MRKIAKKLHFECSTILLLDGILNYMNYEGNS